MTQRHSKKASSRAKEPEKKQRKGIAAKPLPAKELIWLQEKVDDFTRPPFSAQAQEEVAGLIKRLRRGELLELPQSRPMPLVARGCHELRVRDAEANWRLMIYLDAEVVLVLHIFAKKTQATPREVIVLCQKRLGLYQEVREHTKRLKKKK